MPRGVLCFVKEFSHKFRRSLTFGAVIVRIVWQVNDRKSLQDAGPAIIVLRAYE